MQHNMMLRHRATMEIRKYFDEQGFLEIETPMLDEVDARRRARLPGAEPRPPGGVLRAAAVAADLQADPDDLPGSTATSRSCKCFRDEDLRADRQPEFTQVDLEISFATEDLVFSTSSR